MYFEFLLACHDVGLFFSLLHCEVTQKAAFVNTESKKPLLLHAKNLCFLCVTFPKEWGKLFLLLVLNLQNFPPQCV